MTDAQVNERCAKACGWEYVAPPHFMQSYWARLRDDCSWATQDDCSDFTGDTDEAWANMGELVRRLVKAGYQPSLHSFSNNGDVVSYRCDLWINGGDEIKSYVGTTFPEAVARAFLENN